MAKWNPEERATGMAGAVTIGGWIVGLASFVGSIACLLAQRPDAAGVFMLAAGVTFGLLANALLRH